MHTPATDDSRLKAITEKIRADIRRLALHKKNRSEVDLVDALCQQGPFRATLSLQESASVVLSNVNSLCCETSPVHEVRNEGEDRRRPLRETLATGENPVAGTNVLFTETSPAVMFGHDLSPRHVFVRRLRGKKT
jgi:hypothetical protein